MIIVDLPAAVRRSAESSIRAAINQQISSLPKWRIRYPNGGSPSGATDVWIHAHPIDAQFAPQGWKIHLSATVLSAECLLYRVLPLIVEAAIPFKVAASVEILDLINQGVAGESQVGKFITLYPYCDEQAVKMAVVLHNATKSSGLRGPIIPSDRRFSKDGMVYYRYGSFGTYFVQTSIGEIVPAVASPSGVLFPDHHYLTYKNPHWVVDPFASVVSQQEPDAGPLIQGRYILIATLHYSPRSSVYLATDIIGARVCILKRAHRDAVVDLQGRGGRDRISREAQVLRA